MIDWFTWLVIIVSVLAAVLALVYVLLGKAANDLHLFAAAAVLCLLIAQIVIGIFAPIMGNTPTGSLLEWWFYLITAIIIVVAGTAWTLIDRNKWSSVIHLVIALTVAVMIYRMDQIWFVQIV